MGLASLAASCGPATRVTTVREFIENYSEAMLRKSARRVLAMEADGELLQRFALDAAQREKLARYDREQRRAELKRLFQSEDMWWKAWCMTRYEGERIHGNHIDVDVAVSGARSQVILIRADDGTLRLHPLPGWLHAEEILPADRHPVAEGEEEPPADEGFWEETPEE